MKNMLVTGGAGFIGANFVRFVLANDPGVTIYNLDALTYAGSLENLRDLPAAGRHTFLHGSIGNRDLLDRLLREYAIDTIVNFAAETHVDRSILGPAPFIETNIVGTFTLLEAARQYWLTEQKFGPHDVRFHHVSTDEVFGSLLPGEPAWTETTPYDPHSPYSASKASSDHLVRSYAHTYGLPVTLSNCSNNYGPYQFPEKLIPLIILNALDGKPLPVYGDGQQVRDWLYVEDHCEAIWSILQRGRVGESYNIGGNNQPPNLEIIHTICDILDQCRPELAPHRQLIRFVTDRPGHDRRYAMDITRISAELGWQPRHRLDQGLIDTVSWYLDHPQWVEALRKQQTYQQWVQSNYDHREAAK